MKKSIFFLFFFVSTLVLADTVSIEPMDNNAVFWIDQDNPNTNEPPSHNKWGQVFTVPEGQIYLDSLEFWVRGSGTPEENGATFFQIRLSKWDAATAEPIGSPVYLSEPVYFASMNWSDPRAEWGNPPTRFGIGMSVEAGDTYIAEVIGDGMAAMVITAVEAYTEGGLALWQSDIGWHIWGGGHTRAELVFMSAMDFQSRTLKTIIYMKALRSPPLDYLSSAHTGDDCTGAGGSLFVVSGDSNGTQVCRLDQATCPANWTMAAGWSTTTEVSQSWSQATVASAPVTCNGVTETFAGTTSASGSLPSGLHGWSNNAAIETANCRILAPTVTEANGDCGDIAITHADTANSSSCSGGQYVSSIAFKDQNNAPLSIWVRVSSVRVATATRSQVGCY